MTGTLNGTYVFTMDSSTPADARVPGLMFFTGRSVISTRRGETLSGVDVGLVDLSPLRQGAFVSVLTFESGTGDFDGGAGQISLRGTLDPVTGLVQGDYEGEYCH